jgi:hypothetical protein
MVRVGMLVALAAIGCGPHRAAAPPAAAAPREAAVAPASPAGPGSGFLDDYARLVPGVGDQPTFVYRDPNAQWERYDRILFEPVAIWRSGKGSLSDVPQRDLERLASTLQRSVRSRLRRSFRLVKRPGPNVLRVRLALTVARADDPVLDVFTWAVPPTAPPPQGPLAPATQRFVDAAAIEGEVSDAESGTVFAAGVDRRRRQALTTWAELEAASDRWAAWFAERLERAQKR